jgi:hypothetical protein
MKLHKDNTSCYQNKKCLVLLWSCIKTIVFFVASEGQILNSCKDTGGEYVDNSTTRFPGRETCKSSHSGETVTLQQ